jgi:hypothetical protein
MDLFFKKAAEMADGVLDLAGWIGKRIECKKSLVAHPDDLIGLSAEVTATINKGGAGEVVVVADNARLNYSARAENDQQEFKKGEMVTIIRAGTSLLYVAQGAPKQSGDRANDKSGDHSCCDHAH